MNFYNKYKHLLGFKKMQTVQQLEREIPPAFDEKFKVIMNCGAPDNFIEMLYWLNTHSTGAVSVKSNEHSEMYVGFEKPDDALVFKIKFL